MKRSFVVIFCLLVIGGIGFFVYQRLSEQEVACTMEARLCPDGSYVGRVPPRCEFTSCPTVPVTATPTPYADDNVRLSSPLPESVVTSPLRVTGEARGTWYFEASFPVRLLDGNSKELAVMPAQALAEWMTTEFVPFETVLTFPESETATGTLVLEKDNPSGLPENAAEIRIPIRFR